jgi:hypothetical protein
MKPNQVMSIFFEVSGKHYFICKILYSIVSTKPVFVIYGVINKFSKKIYMQSHSTNVSTIKSKILMVSVRVGEDESSYNSPSLSRRYLEFFQWIFEKKDARKLISHTIRKIRDDSFFFSGIGRKIGSQFRVEYL